MKKLILLCLPLLVACGDELVSSTPTTVSIRITDYDPPKHVRVSFTDLTNNNNVNDLHVSKHCSGCTNKTTQTLHGIIRYDSVYRRSDGTQYNTVRYDTCSIKRQLGGTC